MLVTASAHYSAGISYSGDVTFSFNEENDADLPQVMEKAGNRARDEAARKACMSPWAIRISKVSILGVEVPVW